MSAPKDEKVKSMLDLGFEPSDGFWAHVRTLLTSAGPQYQVLSFCGAARGVGTSTIAACYASVLAEESQGTLLVEGHFEHPSVARITGVEATPGLSEFLLGDGGSQDFPVQSTGAESRLDVVPAGEGEKPASHLGGAIMASAKWRSILEECRQHYGSIVIDAGPLLTSGNAMALAKQSDGVVMVSQWSKTRCEVLIGLGRKLEGLKANLLGTVVNRRRNVIPNWVYNRL